MIPELTVHWAILPDDIWLAKRGLKFLSYPVSGGLQEVLVFWWNNKPYWFRAVLFGPYTIPVVLAGVINLILAKLRTLGIASLAYLDDWLILPKQGC